MNEQTRALTLATATPAARASEDAWDRLAALAFGDAASTGGCSDHAHDCTCLAAHGAAQAVEAALAADDRTPAGSDISVSDIDSSSDPEWPSDLEWSSDLERSSLPDAAPPAPDPERPIDPEAEPPYADPEGVPDPDRPVYPEPEPEPTPPLSPEPEPDEQRLAAHVGGATGAARGIGV